MKLGSLVLHLRNNISSFDNAIGGAAEYAMARENTLLKEMAFILPLIDTAEANDYDTSVNQKVTEQFAVVVALKNDNNFADKTGFAAYNRLHDIRQELFEAYLGLDIASLYGSSWSATSNSLVYYRGGQLLDLDRAYIWYQFTFEYQYSLEGQYQETDPDDLDDFSKIWADYELNESHDPSDNLPVTEELPINLFSPDMKQLIDFDD